MEDGATGARALTRPVRGLPANQIACALISMMAGSTSSNQRPDTLMQDRIARIEETSCTPRPDHTSGSSTERLRLSISRQLFSAKADAPTPPGTPPWPCRGYRTRRCSGRASARALTLLAQVVLSPSCPQPKLRKALVAPAAADARPIVERVFGQPDARLIRGYRGAVYQSEPRGRAPARLIYLRPPAHFVSHLSWIGTAMDCT